MKLLFLNKRNSITIIIVAILVVGSIAYTQLSGNGGIVGAFTPKKELPIYSVDTSEKKVAISFDAAWGSQYTEQILDTLDEYNVKTTFFLVGFWVDKYPDKVKEIVSRGHEIGNHSSNHPHMPQLGAQQITEELMNTHNKIKDITGNDPILFRPPFGDYNDTLIQTCRDNGYYTIQWDVDSLDWKERGVQPVVDRVIKNAKEGSIILFHNNAKYVAEYLPIIIKELQNQGYEIVPISELIYKDNFYIDHTGKQIQKPNN
ncbi:polysaccharide deacetylase family sporulation protein PdaB [Sporosalibacterium faouarense]|uniref:polysaccharide deacetylase family sporulation protein PdaB n=1 Tax=Sporosalibacterium faouarense TaxID=516123 RepID=UPI00141C2A6D|nr:polysaccharide deacetylase family sporulation protein PdaB [Sporosalibacterium faouarense]MTI49546.1 polysaccharide deacetylase family sporulation protein PdaB [Bacillota bacterium]